MSFFSAIRPNRAPARRPQDRLLFGPGVRLATVANPNGGFDAMPSFPNPSRNQSGAFAVHFSTSGGANVPSKGGNVKAAGFVTVGLGLVQTAKRVIEPVIVQDGVPTPISGGLYDFGNLINASSGAGDIARAASLVVPPPKLPILAEDRDTDNSWSFVCLQATPNATGDLVNPTDLQVVHKGKPQNDDKTGYGVLCALFWQGEQVRQVIQSAQFNLRYDFVSPPPGQGAPRHYFY